MNRENIQKWVDALRSGDYEQGRNQLRSGDGKRFCCLGVACDISGVGEWTSSSMYKTPLDGDSSWSALPLGVQRWLGIPSHNPRVRTNPPGAATETLTVLNDSGSDDFSFSRIADILEENFLR